MNQKTIKSVLMRFILIFFNLSVPFLFLAFFSGNLWVKGISGVCFLLSIFCIHMFRYFQTFGYEDTTKLENVREKEKTYYILQGLFILPFILSTFEPFFCIFIVLEIAYLFLTKEPIILFKNCFFEYFYNCKLYIWRGQFILAVSAKDFSDFDLRKNVRLKRVPVKFNDKDFVCIVRQP